MLIRSVPARLFTKPLRGTAEIDLAHPLTRGLEAFYLLNEDGGLALDLGPFKRHSVSITGAAPAVQPGVGTRGQSLAGHSRDWTANSDLVDVGTWGFSMAQGVTVEAWTFHDTFRSGVDERYVSKADGTGTANHDWMLGNTESGANRFLRCRLARPDVTAVGATNIASRTAQWIHAAATYHADTQVERVFLDGIEDGSNTVTTPSTGATANAVYLGNQPTSATSGPDARIGLVGIWSRALTDDEILWRAKEPFAFLRPVVRRRYWDVPAAAGGATAFPHHYYAQQHGA